MKLLLQLFWIFIFSINYLLAQNGKAQQYYNFLLQEEIAVGSEVVKLSNLLSQGNKEELHTQLLQLKNTSAKCIEKIEEADAYPKSKYLRDACIEYLETFRHLSRNDFKELIDIITKENTDKADKAEVQDYFGKIQHHIQEADVNYKKAKEKFIKTHQLQVADNEFKFYLEQRIH
jgi:hypothetical protein